MAAGIIQMLLGLSSIAAPQFAAITAELLFGTIVFIAGGAELIYAWEMRAFGGSFWRLLRASCFLGTGSILLFSPLTGIMTLALALGATFVIDGVLRLIVASQVHRRHGLMILDGLIGLLLGAMILTGWPANSIFIVGTVVGIRLLFSGILVLVVGRALGGSSV